MCSSGTNEIKPRGDGVVLVDAFFWLVILICKMGTLHKNESSFIRMLWEIIGTFCVQPSIQHFVLTIQQ